METAGLEFAQGCAPIRHLVVSVAARRKFVVSRIGNASKPADPRGLDGALAPEERRLEAGKPPRGVVGREAEEFAALPGKAAEHGRRRDVGHETGGGLTHRRRLTSLWSTGRLKDGAAGGLTHVRMIRTSPCLL